MELHNDRSEILRVNKKCLRELGMNFSEKEILAGHPFGFLDTENRMRYFSTLQRAIETADGEECEVWCVTHSSGSKKEKFRLRCNVCLIGRSDDRYLFFVMIRNLTKRRAMPGGA